MAYYRRGTPSPMELLALDRKNGSSWHEDTVMGIHRVLGNTVERLRRNPSYTCLYNYSPQQGYPLIDGGKYSIARARI